MRKVIFTVSDSWWDYTFYEDGTAASQRRKSNSSEVFVEQYSFQWRWSQASETLATRITYRDGNLGEWVAMIPVPDRPDPFIEAYKAAVGNLVVEDGDR